MDVGESPGKFGKTVEVVENPCANSDSGRVKRNSNRTASGGSLRGATDTPRRPKVVASRGDTKWRKWVYGGLQRPRTASSTLNQWETAKKVVDEYRRQKGLPEMHMLIDEALSPRQTGETFSEAFSKVL